MKPSFQLRDSDTAILLGVYDTAPDALADIKRSSRTDEARRHINDLVLTLELGDPDSDPPVILDGEALDRYGVRRFAGISGQR